MRLILSLLWLVTPLSSLADTGPVENRWGMTFLAIPSGQFIMGTRDIDAATMEHPSGDASQIRDETPPHPVNISTFHLGRTEVTQQQWLAVMDTRPGPEANWQREDWQKLPVVTVSWHRVMDFINALNEQDSAYDYRLPTEAEWEYAARGGRDGLRPFDIDKLDEYAWTISNSGDSLQAVATRRENPFGIHDLYGNAWEWTQDWYAPDYYSNSPADNPQGPPNGIKRVRRGGSFHCPVHLVRPGYRAPELPDKRYSVLGFRLVAEPKKN